MPRNSKQTQFLPASFRDPAGHIFRQDGKIYRQINQSGKDDYELMMSSGLYDALVKRGLLISHKETSLTKLGIKDSRAYKAIMPEQIDFISYPYEWSFGMLKDAALLTIEIQKICLEHGMVLKDASAYNVQFIAGRPVFIDTLSFTKLSRQYWHGYRQFCQHFLAPLALASRVDVRFISMLRDHIDGFPLDLTKRALGTRAKLLPGLFMHIVLHARSQQQYQKKRPAPNNFNLERAKISQIALANHLEKTVRKIAAPKQITTWGDYYKNADHYNQSSFKKKGVIIKDYIGRVKPKTVWDIGGNDGTFSRIVLAAGAKSAVCFDFDYAAVESNYQQLQKDKNKNLLPLYLDLSSPSVNTGWAQQERDGLAERAEDTKSVVMALALMHHLAIQNNIPFASMRDYFARLGEYLIIEFVPKDDEKVKELLIAREDIFTEYSIENFEEVFLAKYNLVSKDEVKGTKRTMYLLRRKK